jgi:LuxR family transcriptional regulator, maltose regulon positive regulatory protein
MHLSEPTAEYAITKLTVPANGPGMIPRPRLTSCLEKAEGYALALISGPAGSGKSSLAAAWAAAEPSPVGWFSIEAEDNDPVRFWRCFTAALQIAVPQIDWPTPVIVPQLGSGILPGSLNVLCNALAGYPQPVFLVLDDVHLIANREIYACLAYLLDHQPANFHLLAASRARPPLPLARWRAKNRLLEIRPAELVFSGEEALALFQNNPKSGLSPEQILKAADLTRGWAAGLRLMEIALSENPDRLEAWSEGRRLVADYLTGEIIQQLPGRWVGFLEKIAVLDAFTLEMAAAIGGDDQAAALLDQISAANLFLERYADTYQLHPFFREALLQRLPDAQRKSLHCAAATWYAAHAAPEKAIAQAIAGEDWAQAVQYILGQSEERFLRGEVHTLESWIGAIPAEERARSVDLRVLQGWVWYLLGRTPEAHQLAADLAGVEKEAQIQQKGLWAGLRCQLALVQEQNREALDLAQIALAHTPQTELFLRGLLLSSLATAQQALGDSDGAVAHFKQAVQVNRQAGNLLIALFSLVSLGIELNDQGQRRRAVELAAEALNDLAGTPDENNPLCGLIYILLARLYWEADQLDEAQQAYAQGAEKLIPLGVPGFQISGDLIYVEILIAREAYAEALKLTQLNRRRSRSGALIGFRQLFDMLRADISLRMGNLAAVEDWLEAAHLPTGPQADPARDTEFIVQARYLVETGSLGQAGQLLEALESFARQTRHARVLISTLLLKAALEWKKGELGRVKLYLEEALELAVPQGYIRLLLDGGAPLLGLLAQLPGAPAEIRARFRASEAPEIPQLVEMLTAREIDVLRLLAEHHTNPEIARSLVLSAETVKVHLKHIFQKLDVADRRQAVARARELEII